MAEVASVAILSLWLALAFLYQPVGASTTLTVVSDCPRVESCWDIDRALDEMSSGTSLHLLPGSHLITRPHLGITGLSNISIVGHDAENTVVSCAENTGLGFIETKSLSLRNFTITNCGLTGANLSYYVTQLRETIDLWFLVPETAKIALLMGNCVNVSIQDVTIRDTTGLGLLGINILGSSELTRVQFLRNIRPHCTDTEPTLPSLITPQTFDQVGGGAYFLYSDYLDNTSEPVGSVRLALKENYFAYNGDCTYAAHTNINFPYYTSNSQGLYDYAIGAGGGLSVVLSNSHFATTVEVSNTEFYHNDARYGGGAYVATFAGFQRELIVLFFNCSFLENGMAKKDGPFRKSYCKGGAGLAIFTDLLKPEHFVGPIPPSLEQFVAVRLVGSKFVGNRAEVQGGGVFAYSLFHTPRGVYDLGAGGDYFVIFWVLIDTVFEGNSAGYGAAAYFSQMVTFSYSGSVSVFMHDLRVSGSRQEAGQELFRGLIDMASAVYLGHVTCVVQGTQNVFSDNFGSALRLDSALLAVFDGSSLVFRNNVARRGGGIHFAGDAPIVTLYPASRLEFAGNRALLEGGAIYFRDQSGGVLRPLNLFQCFLATPSFSSASDPSGNFDLFDSGVVVSFGNNTAPLGSVVFGTSLDTCPWARNIDPRENGDALSLYQTLHRDHASTFVFDAEPVGLERVSTAPTHLEVTFLPEGIRPPLGLFPGQVISVGITVLDFYGETVPAVVTSAVDTPGVQAKSVLGNSGFWYTATYPSQFRVEGTHLGPLTVSVFTQADSLSSSFDVELLPCPLGFEIDLESWTCICDELLLNATSSRRGNLQCVSEKLSLERPGGHWIGPDPDVENITTGDLIVQRCILDFCSNEGSFFNGNTSSPPTTTTTTSAIVWDLAFDVQCRSNRTGLLCGDCAEGFSSVFGTSECRQCSNYWLFLIPVFAIAGAVLFAGIALLGITVDKGPTNVIILFVSVASTYDYLAPNPTYAYFFLPIRLIGLQIGASTCFYNGMTPIHRCFLNFVFPLYLYLLMAIFAVLCRRYSWMSVHFSPAKTLATLVLLCHLNFITICLQILMATRVETVSGKVFYVWFENPNQRYFRGWHGVLGALAVLVGVPYLVPLPFLLLFPGICYKYLHRLSIYFDILWASFKPRCRFWLGLRMLFAAALFLSSRSTAAYSYVVSGTLLVLFTNVQIILQPFKDKWSNYADTVLVTVVIWFYWGGQAVSLGNVVVSKALADAFVGVLIAISYVVMISLFILHVRRQFPSLGSRLCTKAKVALARGCGESGSAASSHEVVGMSDINEATSDADAPHRVVETVMVERPPPSAVDVLRRLSLTEFPHDRVRGVPQYRESLLDSEYVPA